MAELRGHRRAAVAARLLPAFARQHVGAGLRKLKGRWYEVRAGLGLRRVFRDCDDCLSFEFMGNHDEVRRF